MRLHCVLYSPVVALSFVLSRFLFLRLIPFARGPFANPNFSVAATRLHTEVDYKWKLLVRPWALLPFALTAALVVRLATGLW